MHFVVAGLSLSDKLQTVGALAGFAAIVGLAVLSVLYFGQAREVKRLREWAGRAPERAAEMQDRVTTGAAKRVVAQPQAPQSPAQPAPAVPARPSPAQPATPGAAAAAGGVAAGAAAAGAAAAATTTTPASATTPAPPKPADGTDQATVLQPAVPGAGAPPTTPATPAPPKPAPPAATPPVPPAGTPDSGQWTADEPAVPLRSGRSVREAMTQRAAASTSSGEGGHHSPAGATIAIVGAVAAIIVAILLVVTGVIGGGGGDGGSADTNQIVPTATTDTGTGSSTSASTSPSTTQAPDPADVSVVVLNGTGTPNLARNAADALVKDGYTNAGAGNRGDSTIPKTLVMYASGGKRAAQALAKILGVSSVTPLDAGTQVVAQNFAKDGKTPLVVVTLGADKATP